MHLGSQNIVVVFQTGLENVFEKDYVNIYKYIYEVNFCSYKVEYSLRIMRFGKIRSMLIQYWVLSSFRIKESCI